MILNLDGRQNADRERYGACAVPGEPCCESCVGSCACPPRQFSDAAAPCQTCGGTGRCIEPPVVTTYTCPRCLGGKPIIEIRVPCHHLTHTGRMGYLTCSTCGAESNPASGYRWRQGFVVVARATVTLYSDFVVTDGVTWFDSDDAPTDDRRYQFRFDPQPVAGRDSIAVFEEVA